jgi:hypothetical protein
MTGSHVETPAGQQDDRRLLRLKGEFELELEVPAAVWTEQLVEALNRQGLGARFTFMKNAISDSPRMPPPPPPSEPDPDAIWRRPSGYGGAAIAMLMFFLVFATLVGLWVIS